MLCLATSMDLLSSTSSTGVFLPSSNSFSASQFVHDCSNQDILWWDPSPRLHPWLRLHLSVLPSYIQLSNQTWPLFMSSHVLVGHQHGHALTHALHRPHILHHHSGFHDSLFVESFHYISISAITNTTVSLGLIGLWRLIRYKKKLFVDIKTILLFTKHFRI